MFPKPEPHGKVRRREKRLEQIIKSANREAVFERDRDCRFPESARENLPCGGRHTLAHLISLAMTRGRSPEHRHNLYITARICQAHHEPLDHGGKTKLRVELDARKGANAPIKWFDVDGRLLGYG